MTQYKYLIWSATLALLILSLFLTVSINHVLNTAATTNTVSFSGEGKVTAKPDVAVADISIVTEASNSKAAQDENSRRSKQVVDFLKSQGIKDEDVKTTGYNLYPQYNYPQFQKPTINGYSLNQSIQVKIRNLEKVSAILDGVVTKGANQVNNLSYQIDNPEKLKDKARQKAITDAKERAQTLEKQIGIKLGKIVNFSENISGNTPPSIYAKEYGGGVGGGGPSLPTGENEITVDINLTYQIR